MSLDYKYFILSASSQIKIIFTDFIYPTRISEKFKVEKLLFDHCLDCLNLNMSFVPQGAFAAVKIRKNLESESNYQFTQPSQLNNEVLEHPPLKYNSKLMNSIWGMYNKYSVHNFKKNTDGAAEGEKLMYSVVSPNLTSSYM